MKLNLWFARRVYALLQKLLPRWLLERSGAAMREVFDARLAAAPTRLASWGVLLHELGGLVMAAAAARLASRRVATIPAERKANRMDRLLQDVRYALRGMRRSPSLMVLTVLTLGLGIGATTAMYSVIDGVLLRPLPFDRPEQIVLVYPSIEEWRGNPALSDGADRGRFNYPELEAWKAQQTSFTAAGGLAERTARVPTDAGAERVTVAAIDASIWAVLGAPAQHGRLFTGEEADPADVVVLTHRFWQTRFDGDPSAIGRDMQLDDRPVRITGVLPRNFELSGVDADLWQPLVIEPGNRGRGNHSLRGIGRLRAGVTHARAEAELTSILRAVNETDGPHLTHEGRLANPIAEVAGGYRAPLLVLLAAAAVLLVAACASVALLLLGAGADRARELAVRGALGANQTRLAVQLFVESMVLAMAAAVAGLLIASGLLRVLLYLAPARLPRADQIAVDWMSFAFTAAIGVACALVIGAFPALSLSRVRAVAALRVGATAPGRSRLQRPVVIVQLALATMLLAGAGLLTRTMHELQSVDPGFDAGHLLTLQLELPVDLMRDPDGGWSGAPARRQAYADRVSAAIASLAGVEAVAMINMMPFGGGRATTSVEPEEHISGDDVSVAMRTVSANYMAVMGIPLVQGRGFTADDERQDAEPVVLVNERLARAYWPDGRWAGRRLRMNGVDYRVAGVVADAHEQDVRGDTDVLKVFTPPRLGSLGNAYVIRTRVDSRALVADVRQRIADIDRSLVVGSLMPMSDRIAVSLAEYRYRMRLMLAFSVIAALFALLGVYGVMSRAVAGRRQELGVRLAFGATKGRIVSLVLRDGLRVAVAGVAAGAAAGLIASRSLETMIWGIPRTDAVTFVAVAGALILLALLASLAPAVRAALLEPAHILRG